MNIENLLKKHQANQPDDTNEPDSIDDQGAYGLIRAQRERAMMVELRKKDGTVHAIPYAVIEQIQYSPSDGITIHACGREIKITGRNLNGPPNPKVSLFNGLCRHRIAWVQEYSRTAASESNTATTQVESIVF